MDTSHVLSTAVTPIVLISACGLVTLALYNRLGSILARIRTFHQQKIALLDNLPGHDFDESEALLDMIDQQIRQVIVKARVIQKALYCLLSATFAFLLCSLFAGAAVLNPPMGSVALGTGTCGIGLFLGGIALALRELSLSLTPLEEESAYLDVVTKHRWTKSRAGNTLKIAKSA